MTAGRPTPPPVAPRPVQPARVEEQGPQSTLLGGMTALPEGMTRLSPNTDQATVPLIDFDLSGAELPLNTAPGRTVAMTGSPMASQIATKLDLARGYIDLGVRDGADVWVEGPEKGKVLVKAMVTERVAPGVAFMPFHFGGHFQGRDLRDKYPEGADPYVLGEASNTAQTYGYDSVTQMQETKATLCKIWAA